MQNFRASRHVTTKFKHILLISIALKSYRELPNMQNHENALQVEEENQRTFIKHSRDPKSYTAMQIRMGLLTSVSCSYSLSILSADQENFTFEK